VRTFAGSQSSVQVVSLASTDLEAEKMESDVASRLSISEAKGESNELVFLKIAILIICQTISSREEQ